LPDDGKTLGRNGGCSAIDTVSVSDTLGLLQEVSNGQEETRHEEGRHRQQEEDGEEDDPSQDRCEEDVILSRRIRRTTSTSTKLAGPAP
jgi:hypothetical protein